MAAGALALLVQKSLLSFRFGSYPCSKKEDFRCLLCIKNNLQKIKDQIVWFGSSTVQITSKMQCICKPEPPIWQFLLLAFFQWFFSCVFDCAVFVFSLFFIVDYKVCGVVGGPVSLGVVRRVLLAGWTRLRERCIAGCSSGSGGVDCDNNPTGMGLSQKLCGVLLAGWTRLRERCIAGCSSGSGGVDCDNNPTGKYWKLSQLFFGPCLLSGPSRGERCIADCSSGSAEADCDINLTGLQIYHGN